jgi:hypothetical protein
MERPKQKVLSSWLYRLATIHARGENDFAERNLKSNFTKKNCEDLITSYQGQ